MGLPKYPIQRIVAVQLPAHHDLLQGWECVDYQRLPPYVFMYSA